MKNILIIQKHPKIKDQEIVKSELTMEGYAVKTIEFESVDFNTAPLFWGFDLAIVHIYPNITASWEAYQVLKHHFPHLPVLVYMHHHGVHTLKSAIRNIFSQNPPTVYVKSRQQFHTLQGSTTA